MSSALTSPSPTAQFRAAPGQSRSSVDVTIQRATCRASTVARWFRNRRQISQDRIIRVWTRPGDRVIVARAADCSARAPVK
jgi:hypothetical protein